MKSKRIDGRGHWPAGRHRSTLTAAERRHVLASLRRLRDRKWSLREIARALGVSDRTPRRWLTGERWPDARIAARLGGIRTR